MDDLISRKALIAAFEQGCRDGNICAFEDTSALIESQPAIDAVPVVRCRWCLHHRFVRERHMCAKYAALSGNMEIGLCATNPDDFCSWGKRREDTK